MERTTSSFSEIIDGAAPTLVLAPLTKGGNLPYRRLCARYGADITVSEMAYARFIVKGEGREKALLRRHPSERCFGVQLAALQPEEAVAAAKQAVDAGADFVDINCGCPIEEVVRRGLGSSLLRRPKTLFRLVEALAAALPVPVTVKVRLGWGEEDINVREIAKGVETAGASALSIHGRTREQRYSKAANWEIIGETASLVRIPVFGNGDILTYYEASRRLADTRIRGLMIGRGALMKPWIFQEIKEQRELMTDPRDRVGAYFELAGYMKEHFGADDLGRRRCMNFLPWHFSFFHRYEPLPAEEFEAHSMEHPLMQTRGRGRAVESPLERALSSDREGVHVRLAEILLDAPTADHACERIEALHPELEALESMVVKKAGRERDALEQG